QCAHLREFLLQHDTLQKEKIKLEADVSKLTAEEKSSAQQLENLVNEACLISKKNIKQADFITSIDAFQQQLKELQEKETEHKNAAISLAERIQDDINSLEKIGVLVAKKAEAKAEIIQLNEERNKLL